MACAQAALLLLQAYEHRRFAASRLRGVPLLKTQRRTLLIVPCRGAEPGLAENLERFFRQDHPNYSIRFVVERAADPAYAVIRELIAAHPHSHAEVLVAGETTGEAQKVHNLRQATADLPRDVEVLAFADSDAAPAAHWLRLMVARLDEPQAASVTGYRWFLANGLRIADLVVYSINAGYAVLLGRSAPNLVWGGSWAILRTTFEELNIRDAWAGTICDDLKVADVLQHAGRRVEFEPACIIPTRNHWNLSQTLAFLERQFSLARHVVPRWWWAAVLLQSFSQISFWGLTACAGMAWSPTARLLAAWSLALLYVLYALRAVCRAWATRTYFPTEWRGMGAIFLADILLAPVLALVGWLALISGGLRRTIVWRGIVYRRDSQGRWSVVSRRSAETSPATTIAVMPSEADRLAA